MKLNDFKKIASKYGFTVHNLSGCYVLYAENKTIDDYELCWFDGRACFGSPHRGEVLFYPNIIYLYNGTHYMIESSSIKIKSARKFENHLKKMVINIKQAKEHTRLAAIELDFK